MHNRKHHEENGEGGVSSFIAGALIGAGVALLFAPQTGTELRGMLGNYAGRAKDDLLEKAEEIYDEGEEHVQEAGRSAREFAKQGVKKGRESVKEAGEAAKEFVTQATAEAQKAGR